MNRPLAFLIILISALVFLASFLPAIRNSSYGNLFSVVGQAGLALGILFFFIAGRKRR